MKLAIAKSFFPEVMSRCCEATVYEGFCCHCGHLTQLPYYFYSRVPQSDYTLVQKEQEIRAVMPKGAEFIFLVKSPQMG
jgi:hypothetical protein